MAHEWRARLASLVARNDDDAVRRFILKEASDDHPEAQGRAFFRAVKGLSIAGDVETAGKVVEVAYDTPGIRRTPILFGQALAGACAAGNTGEAVAASQRMIKAGFSSLPPHLVPTLVRLRGASTADPEVTLAAGLELVSHYVASGGVERYGHLLSPVVTALIPLAVATAKGRPLEERLGAAWALVARMQRDYQIRPAANMADIIFKSCAGDPAFEALLFMETTMAAGIVPDMMLTARLVQRACKSGTTPAAPCIGSCGV